MEMTSTYDFIHEIDDIEKMNIEGNFNEGSSMLDITIQNVSLDMGPTDRRMMPSSTNKKGQQNENRALDMKKL